MNTTDTIKNLAKKLDKELAKFEYQQDEIYATIQITKAEMLALEEIGKSEKFAMWYKDRNKLAVMFEKWCEENNAEKSNATNVITWLYANDLLKPEVMEFIKEKQKWKS